MLSLPHCFPRACVHRQQSSHVPLRACFGRGAVGCTGRRDGARDTLGGLEGGPRDRQQLLGIARRISPPRSGKKRCPTGTRPTLPDPRLTLRLPGPRPDRSQCDRTLRYAGRTVRRI